MAQQHNGASPSALPAIRACLFDMDGLLIDSEDKYTICTNEVLRKYGKPDLPWSIKAQLQGRPAPTSGQILQDWAQLPIGREEWLAQIQALQRQHFPSCQALPGVEALLRTLAASSSRSTTHDGGPPLPVHMALATSSNSRNFALKTAHISHLFDVFAARNRVLGDDARIPPGRGKPAPDIYLLALQTINEKLKAEGRGEEEVTPAECLVFEDSVPGVESGRRAGMQVVWCPHPELLKEYAGREERVLAGLMGEHQEVEEKNEDIGVVAHDGSTRTKGAPGEIGDGWATLLTTLEDFPYAAYKINVNAQNHL